ncbi:MAG: tetratricopeptide repeat protein [Deltaproteobacteria bacterium]|nr:tetratricopeptide repeat protein [Deltaproteobacteria bacterium]
MSLKTNLIFFIAAAAILSFVAFQRNLVFINEMMLWQDARDKSPFKARPHTNLGAALKSKWLIKDAEREFKIAVGIDPTDHDSAINLADIFRLHDQLKGAEAMLAALIRRYPTSPYGHNNLGNVYGDMRRYDDAVREYGIALKLKPFFPDAHNNMAVIYKREGRTNDALKEAVQAVSMIPDNPIYRNNLALVLIDMGKFREALDELKIVERIAPEYPDIYERMARLYDETNDIAEAISAARKAVSRNPEDFKAHVSLGNIYKKANPEMAIKEYEKALEINPACAEAHYNLAVTMEETGRQAEAARHYKMFIENAPQELKGLAKKVKAHLEGR